MKKYVIIGAEGATGKALRNKLLKDTFIGFDYSPRSKDIRYVDITDKNSLLKEFKDIKAECLINCAGSFTHDFMKDMNLNVIGTKNILDTLIDLNIKMRVVLIGSSAEYGKPMSKSGSIGESHPLVPLNIYGLTKKIQYEIFRYYIENSDLDIIYLRPFNLISKDLSTSLFIGNLYDQIEKYKLGKIDSIRVGNLEAYRDYLNIEKAVEYYMKMCNYLPRGEVVNIGSGKPVKIKELLWNVLNAENLNYVKVESVVNSSKTEVEYLFADVSKLLSYI